MVHIELLYDVMKVRKSEEVLRLCNMSDKSGVYSIQVYILKNYHTVESAPLSNVHIYWFPQALLKRGEVGIASRLSEQMKHCRIIHKGRVVFKWSNHSCQRFNRRLQKHCYFLRWMKTVMFPIACLKQANVTVGRLDHEVIVTSDLCSFFNHLMFRLRFFLLLDERKGPSVLFPNCSGPGEEAG